MLLKHAKTDHAIGDLISQHDIVRKKNHNTFTFKNLFTLKKKKKKSKYTQSDTVSDSKTSVKSLILKLIPPPH